MFIILSILIFGNLYLSHDIFCLDKIKSIKFIFKGIYFFKYSINTFSVLLVYHDFFLNSRMYTPSDQSNQLRE